MSQFIIQSIVAPVVDLAVINGAQISIVPPPPPPFSCRWGHLKKYYKRPCFLAPFNFGGGGNSHLNRTQSDAMLCFNVLTTLSVKNFTLASPRRRRRRICEYGSDYVDSDLLLLKLLIMLWIFIWCCGCWPYAVNTDLIMSRLTQCHEYCHDFMNTDMMLWILTCVVDLPCDTEKFLKTVKIFLVSQGIFIAQGWTSERSNAGNFLQYCSQKSSSEAFQNNDN